MEDPKKSRVARDLLTAEKTEEYYLYASSEPVLCYTYFIKFLLNNENEGMNDIPIVFSKNNKDLI